MKLTISLIDYYGPASVNIYFSELSMPLRTATLVVKDFVNCRFEGVDDATKALMCEALKFHVPEARHMPQYKLGRWDGTVSFCTQAGNTFINVIERVLPILIDANYQIELIDRRPDHRFSFPAIDERYFAQCLWPEGHVHAGQPILLRDYQITAINLFLSNLNSIQQIVMGAGKTILTAALSRSVEGVGRSMVIVPSKSLVRQTETDYRNVGLDVGVFYGERKDYGHQHTIFTWQTLVSLAKRGRAKGKASSLTALLDGVICVICDECFAADTPVLTPTGWQPIQTLQAGDRVINWDQQALLFKEDRVVKVHENTMTTENMYELVMDDQTSLQVTGNHRFLTGRGWVRADELTPADEIVAFNSCAA